MTKIPLTPQREIDRKTHLESITFHFGDKAITVGAGIPGNGCDNIPDVYYHAPIPRVGEEVVFLNEPGDVNIFGSMREIILKVERVQWVFTARRNHVNIYFDYNFQLSSDPSNMFEELLP